MLVKTYQHYALHALKWLKETREMVRIVDVVLRPLFHVPIINVHQAIRFFVLI